MIRLLLSLIIGHPKCYSPGRSLFYPEDFSEDSGGPASDLLERNGAFTEESDSMTQAGRSLKRFHDMFGSAEGRGWRSLEQFQEQNSGGGKSSKAEAEIQSLKKLAGFSTSRARRDRLIWD
ncbi:hypothetical protein EUGRSUZ_C01645 [Eucalyptus grandis]|uniref:Uncharacterized protein n=2 Tax=Eucalyptus grandis TaxID=71139 RepID=A0ACC3LG09_EUCGR|nr:hypothetical protein EUGRSUZ_C01645 [Eucalyptus grandis]